jgi:hypothetical protein
MYHMDGHEKIAKVYGIWVHGGIDGYSRFIVYLRAATNKFAETVRAIYREGCEAHGWPSRGRWDKGSENKLAILDQIDHHYDEARPSTLKRGSAITGPSTQNCRIEYLWRFVRMHVTGKFRAAFNEMRNRGLIDPTDPIDLFYLQAVFLPIVQQALDRFRRMWNEHLIAGRRTVSGHGGGVPSELFRDPIHSGVAFADSGYESGRLGPDVRGRLAVDETSQYGAEAPLAGEAEEMMIQSLKTSDPLECSPLLQHVRDMYLQRYPLQVSVDHLTARSSDWEKMERHVQEYLRFRELNGELLALAAGFWSSDGSFDWAAFAQSDGATAYSRDSIMRTCIAELGLSVGVR